MPYVLIMVSVDCEDSHGDDDFLFCWEIDGNMNLNFYPHNSSVLVSSFHAISLLTVSPQHNHESFLSNFTILSLHYRHVCCLQCPLYSAGHVRLLLNTNVHRYMYVNSDCVHVMFFLSLLYKSLEAAIGFNLVHVIHASNLTFNKKISP